ncbi:hypothetical protein PTKIN_Ptkin06aG0020800 [Pterospermum kingtungense]
MHAFFFYKKGIHKAIFFFTCEYSKRLWQEVLRLCGLQCDVRDWYYEFALAMKQIRGKALISTILRIGWNAVIEEL